MESNDPKNYALSNVAIDLQFINIDKFINYKRLLNVTELVLTFINNLKKRLNKKKVVQKYVSNEEYSKTEHIWLLIARLVIVRLIISILQKLQITNSNKRSQTCWKMKKTLLFVQEHWKMHASIMIDYTISNYFTELVMMKRYHNSFS